MPATVTMLSRCAMRCSRVSQSTIQGTRAASTASLIGSDVVIPPESPRYTYIPTSPQTTIITKKPHKGTLPTPRHALQVKDSQVKWHIENTMPEPVTVKRSETHEKHKELAEWKSEETKLRRENFKRGFPELRSRRGVPGKPMNAKNRRKLAIKHERLMGPEPFYEEMSRPSVITSMTKQTVWRHSRRSEWETERRKARFAKLQQNQEHDRRTSFHTLYMNAKKFIVTNEQLEKKLEEVFESDFYEYNKNKNFGVWDEQGWPEDTAYLMDKAENYEGTSAVSRDTGYTETARKRIMKVTEEMTGGKLVLEDRETLHR